MPYGRKEIIRTRKSGTDFTNDPFYPEEYGSGQWKPVSLLGIFYCSTFGIAVFIGVLYGRCPLEYRLVQHVSVLGLYASYAAQGNSFGNYVYRPRHSAGLESDRQPVCADRSHHVFAGIPLRRSQFFLDAPPFSAL